MWAVASLFLVQSSTIPELTPGELAEAKAKGWELVDKTSDDGIRRRYFESERGGTRLRQGLYAQWRKDGTPEILITFKDDAVEGPLTRWHPNGKLKEHGDVRLNQEEGLWKEWNENGVLVSERTYRAGVPAGMSRLFYGGGKRAAAGSFRDGLQSGPWTFWNPDGSVKAKGVFERGVFGGSEAKPKLIQPPPFKGKLPEMTVEVDERMELLAVIQSMTSWPNYGSWTRFDESYKKDVESWFSPHKNHPAVIRYNELLEGGTNWAFDGPVNWILHYGPLPELKEIVPPGEDVVKRAGGKESMDKLIGLIRQFVKDSKFQEFYASHKGFYQELVDGYLAKSPGIKGVELLARYYGESLPTPTVIICPLFGGGNYGVQINYPEGNRIFNVGAPHGYRDGKFTYDRQELLSMIFHEFGHSFSNPIVASNKDLNNYERFFAGVDDRMSRQAYGSWHTTMIELFNRTHELRLLELFGEGARARNIEGLYVKRGFVWLPYLLNKIPEYEANRDIYPTMKSFFPKLKAVLDETEPFDINGVTFCVLPKGKS